MGRIFEQVIGAQGKKQSTHMNVGLPLLECFSRLSPKCRDEELEDLVYFILDLYQFHGVQVAIAEVDVDHVVVDLRTALEEHAARVRGQILSQEDEHVFLVLNRCLQEIPWESLPILRGRSISRIPNVDFLIDRLEFTRRRHKAGSCDPEQYDAHTRLDSSRTYYILNPSGDLEGTERRFSPWLRSMQAVGWDGIIGRAPSEQEFSNALLKNELVMYVPTFIRTSQCSLTTLFLLVILVTEVVNSTFDRTRFGIYLDVRPPCSGAVLLACYGIWASLTVLGPPTITCLRDGE
jgi:separase